jgi:8-oxo-dGTP pyrophosphatase MutT (NUDIX family)
MPWERTLVLIEEVEEEAGWSPQPVWTVLETFVLKYVFIYLHLQYCNQ